MDLGWGVPEKASSRGSEEDISIGQMPWSAFWLPSSKQRIFILDDNAARAALVANQFIQKIAFCNKGGVEVEAYTQPKFKDLLLSATTLGDDKTKQQQSNKILVSHVAPPEEFTRAAARDMYFRQGFDCNKNYLTASELAGLPPEVRDKCAREQKPCLFVPKRFFQEEEGGGTNEKKKGPHPSLFVHVNKFLVPSPHILILHHPPTEMKIPILHNMILTLRPENSSWFVLSTSDPTIFADKVLRHCDLLILSKVAPPKLHFLFTKMRLHTLVEDSEMLIQLTQELSPHDHLVLFLDSQPPSVLIPTTTPSLTQRRHSKRRTRNLSQRLLMQERIFILTQD